MVLLKLTKVTIMTVRKQLLLVLLYGNESMLFYYYRRSNLLKFEQIFSSKNKRTLSKLANIYITAIMKQL